MVTTTVKDAILKPPQAVDIYVRQSDARDDERQGGIDDHIQRCRKACEQRGWIVRRVVVENDVPDGQGGTKRKKSASAFKRKRIPLPDGKFTYRVIRPGFQSIVTDMWADECDGLMVVAFDRAIRDQYDLEDLISVVQHKRLNVSAIDGMILTDGGTDPEIQMAQFRAMVANGESRAKRARQLNTRERDAHKAKGNGQSRIYGWGPDYATAVPAERDLILDASKRFLQNASIRGMAAELQADGVPSFSGNPWTPEMLKELLIRPRNARLVVLQEKIQEDRLGEWDELVPPELFYAVVDKFNDPTRKAFNHGNTPKWLGTGIYLCGPCGDGTTVQVNQGRYICKKKAHLSRNRDRTDELVVDWVIDRLSQPDAVSMFAPNVPQVDFGLLRSQRAAINERLETMAADHIAGEPITRGMLHKATKRAMWEIAQIDRVLNQAVGGNTLIGDLVIAEDIRATWDGYPLSTQRAILRTLVRVEILAAGGNPGRYPVDKLIIEQLADNDTEPADNEDEAA